MSTAPKPRDRRPASSPERQAADHRAELQQARDAAAEAATDAAYWRLAYEYGIRPEDLALFRTMPPSMKLIRFAQRLGTKQPTAPAATDHNPGETASQL